MTYRVLGLDASTTTIGIAVIDFEDNGSMNLVHHGFYKPPKNGHIVERLASVREFIYGLMGRYQPNDVALEDIILFMKGHSTAQTVSSLAVLNRTVGLAVYNQSGRVPNMLNVMAIRHALKTDKELPAKEEIPELVAHYLKQPFPYRKNKKGNVATENFDMADAMAVAIAFWKKKVEQLKPKPSKRKKRKA